MTATKATKQQVIKRCKELGVMLTDTGECLRIDAPVGKIIVSASTHYYDLYLHGWTRPDAYGELMNEMKEGLSACEDADCDSCVHEPMTFEEIHKLYGGERLA